MITCFYKDFNTKFNNNYNFQSVYDDFINNQIDFFTLKCPCGHSGLTKHAYYTRTVKTVSGSIKVRILRVICLSCKHTHAVTLHCIVPYYQILFNQHITIITGSNDDIDELMSLYDLDEANIRYIMTQYRLHWKERLISHSICIDDDLLGSCFKWFNRQFMQIRCLKMF